MDYRETTDLSLRETQTRIIALGSVTLMDGFALLGIETRANASKHDVETLLDELIEQHQRAFILLESYLAHFDLTILKKIRETGGDIIVTEIPSLKEPDNYHPEIDQLIIQALGPNALEDNQLDNSNSEYSND